MFSPRQAPQLLAPSRKYSRLSHTSDIRRVKLDFSVLEPTIDSSEGPLVILHGLFGSRRNWNSLCKAFHRDLSGRAVYSLDMRNHGSSPHGRPHTYQAMAEDVKQFFETHGLRNVSLLGHSMGAKVAMTVALDLAAARQGDDTISKLVIGDMAPVRLNLSSRPSQYISAMQDINALPRGMVKTLADADRILDPFEQDIPIRQFLLTNLVLPSHSRLSNPHSDKAKFRIPLDILQEAMPAMGDFPFDSQSTDRPIWNGPTLVVAGSRSEYQVLKHTHAFKAFFPNSTFETLDAGHWIQSEKPNEFKKLVVDFIKVAS